MKKATLIELQAHKCELERSLERSQRLLFGPYSRKSNVRHMMHKYIQPREADVENRRWCSAAQLRYENLAEAKQEADIMKGVKNGRLTRPNDPTLKEKVFLGLIDCTRELTGLMEILDWLKQFETTVEDGDTMPVMCSLAQLGVSPTKGCDCDPKDDEVDSLAWLHQNHERYNRAVWEIIATKHGMIDSLRKAILEDVEGARTRLGTRYYGEIIAVSYSRDLLKFFVKEVPSVTWIGTTTKVA